MEMSKFRLIGMRDQMWNLTELACGCTGVRLGIMVITLVEPVASTVEEVLTVTCLQSAMEVIIVY